MAMRNLQWGGALLGLLAVAAVRPVSAAPTLTVGSASGQAGTMVNLPISFDPTTASIAAFQFDLTLPAGLTPVSFSTGTILVSAGKSVGSNILSNIWRFVAYSLSQTQQLNQNTVPSGAALTAQLMIAAGTPAGTLNVPASGAVYVDPSANAVTGSVSGGAVTVTSAFSSCDLNQDGHVSGADAQLEVNMILGYRTCTGDINNDTRCSGADYQRIVVAILGGQCVTTP